LARYARFAAIDEFKPDVTHGAFAPVPEEGMGRCLSTHPKDGGSSFSTTYPSRGKVRKICCRCMTWRGMNSAMVSPTISTDRLTSRRMRCT
jgi:hypothetical protein